MSITTLLPTDEKTVREIVNTYVIGDFLKAYLTDTSDNVNMSIQLARERNLIFSDSVEALRALPNFYLADILKTAIDYVSKLRKYEGVYTSNKVNIDAEIAKISKPSGGKYTDLADLQTAPLLKYYRELERIITLLKIKL